MSIGIGLPGVGLEWAKCAGSGAGAGWDNTDVREQSVGAENQ